MDKGIVVVGGLSALALKQIAVVIVLAIVAFFLLRYVGGKALVLGEKIKDKAKEIRARRQAEAQMKQGQAAVQPQA